METEMGSSGSFPIDIVLFGMIAAFLVLRLRSVLGRRQGFERPAEPLPPEGRPVPQADGPIIEGQVVEGTGEPVRTRDLPDPASPAGQAIARMMKVDPNLHVGRF